MKLLSFPWRKPKPEFSDLQRAGLFLERTNSFSERMAEERRKRGHITYPKGATIHPGAWPACPPGCEHVKPTT